MKTLTVVGVPSPAPVRAVTVKIYSVPLSSVLGVVKVVSGTSSSVVCVESLSPYSTL